MTLPSVMPQALSKRSAVWYTTDMPTYIRETSPEELSALRRFGSSSDATISRRANILLSSAGGKTTGDIARLLAIAERTVRNTIRAFGELGLDSVYPVKPSGRPTILSDEQRNALLEMLSRSPSEFGFDSRAWRLSDIASVMEDRNIALGISLRTLRREIKRCGIDLSEIKLDGAIKIPPCGSENSDEHDQQVSSPLLCLSPDKPTTGRSLYADRMLLLGERSLYDEVIKNFKDNYAAIATVHDLHLELAAIYCVKLIRAQTDGDWEQAERFDRMMQSHLKELKAAKKKQETQRGRKTGDTPAERAAAIVEALRAEGIERTSLEGDHDTEDDVDDWTVP
jgi:transposase